MGKRNKYYKAPILNLVYERQPISRIGIGRITGIRLATITEVVRELIAKGLVREKGKKERRKGAGRKEALLEIVQEGRFFIGCELLPSKIDCLILNFKGKIVGKKSAEIRYNEDSLSILSDITSLVLSLIKETRIPKTRIYGLGFVDPGIIDVEKGIAVFSSIMPNWRDVPVKKYLEKKLGFSVFLINTSQAKVLAEHLFGRGKGINNLIFVEYGEGISCGIISEGKVIGGYTEIAGEMGHFTFPERREKCRCGKKGCLEAIAGIPAIEKKVRQLRKEKDISIEGIVSAFEKGDPVACKIMDEASSFLSIAVANVIKLLNPELVVLDRNFLRLGEKFLSIFLSGIRSHLLYGEAVRFDISNIGNDQAALGGAALTLQHFLKQGV